MPDDDLILRVKQIAQYPTKSSAASSDSFLLQEGGVGGPYKYVTPSGIVSSFTDPLSTQLNSLQIQFSGFNQTLLDYQTAWTDQFNSTIDQINANNEFTINSLFQNSVRSFNGRRGDINFTLHDIMELGGAPQRNPMFTGTALLNGDPLATVGFMGARIAEQFTLDNLLCLGLAPIDSPPLQGRPTAPTPPSFDSSNRIATTMFVNRRFRAFEQDTDLKIDEGFRWMEDHIEDQILPIVQENVGNLIEEAVGDQLAQFVKKTGDTMSGQLTIKMPQAKLDLRGDDMADIYVESETFSAQFLVAKTAPTDYSLNTYAGHVASRNGTGGAAKIQGWKGNALTGGASRWEMYLGDGADETGLNAGSNFCIKRYNDNDSYAGQPVTISRAFGLTTIQGNTQSLYVTPAGFTYAGNWVAKFDQGNLSTMAGGDTVVIQGTESFGTGSMESRALVVSHRGRAPVVQITSTSTSSLSDAVVSVDHSQGYGFRVRNTTSNKEIRLNSSDRSIGGGLAALTRWWMTFGDTATESGSNVGSNFVLNRYTDTGTLLGSVLSITRSTGNATFSNDVRAGSFTAVGDYSGNTGNFVVNLSLSNLANGIHVNSTANNMYCYQGTLGTASYYSAIYRAINNATSACDTFSSLGTGTGNHIRCLATDNTEVVKIARNGQVTLNNVVAGSGMTINNSAASGPAIYIQNSSPNSYGLQVQGRGIYLEVPSGEQFALDINHGNNTAGKPNIYLRGANPTEPVLAVWRWQPDTTRRMWINADGSTYINYSGTNIALDISSSGVGGSLLRLGIHLQIGNDGSLSMSQAMIGALKTILGIG